MQWGAGSTYAPDGRILTESGAPIQTPAEEAAVLQAATCCALCNDSTLTYSTGEPYLLPDPMIACIGRHALSRKLPHWQRLIRR